jgi:hypothetical protein
MESNILSYFEEISDEWLILMADQNWRKLEELCTLLTLDIEMAKQERLKN